MDERCKDHLCLACEERFTCPNSKHPHGKWKGFRLEGPDGEVTYILYEDGYEEIFNPLIEW